MKIIVGLGNFGEKYLKTRHNCGFLVLDELVKQLEEENISVKWKEETKLQSSAVKINFNGKSILLVKPLTYMNLSGDAVSKVLNFYKENLENLIVIYDDIDLPLGKIRIRDDGSAGTHNGMKSIIQSLGTEKFKRIRIGIESRGKVAPKEQDLSNFVLSNFTKPEYGLISESLKEAVKELKKML
ncbi:aminoacyl-tRNA hydrolase [Candidatus Peregrinibacteria bacterium]|nr:aminoacyl-tRNA hydrolase [Candidatus Peregrinibacteria bacterium]